MKGKQTEEKQKALLLLLLTYPICRLRHRRVWLSCRPGGHLACSGAHTVASSLVPYYCHFLCGHSACGASSLCRRHWCSSSASSIAWGRHNRWTYHRPLLRGCACSKAWLIETPPLTDCRRRRRRVVVSPHLSTHTQQQCVVCSSWPVIWLTINLMRHLRLVFATYHNTALGPDSSTGFVDFYFNRIYT